MNKKKWALLVLCIGLFWGYFKFFYKTYSEKMVPKSANWIIALDVKRVTNTLIWNFLTTPGQWRWPSFSKSHKPSWKDMVKVPDYVFAFHSIGQPLNYWYVVLDVKDNNDFHAAMRLYEFEKRNSTGILQEYFSKSLGIEMIKYEDQILLGNMPLSNKNYMRQVGEEIFIKKQYASKETLKQNVAANSHLSLQVANNYFLEDKAIMQANFDKNKIVVDATITPQKQFNFTESKFSYSRNSLCAIGFTQPSEVVYNLIPATAKIKISKAINFDIDSLLLPGNTSYCLDMPGIQNRIDSAISLTYDDNFNPIEKMLVNNVAEPEFEFKVRGEDITGIYNYWNSHGKLEKTPAGDLFIPMPLVKSYCRKENKNELQIISYNYRQPETADSVQCIFFLNIVFSKIPANVKKALPDAVLKAIANMESMQIVTQKKAGKISVNISLPKRQKDVPFLD